MTLQEIYDRYKFGDGYGDKGTAHSYIPVYEELFSRYRHEEINLMEIGVAWGHSICMWREYFSKANITGVDIQLNNFDCPEGVRLVEEDATRFEFRQLMSSEKFDIVIDDGSHEIEDQIVTFCFLRDKMKPGGLYVIEDIYDYDNTWPLLADLHRYREFHDFREKSGRFDDAMVVFYF